MGMLPPTLRYQCSLKLSPPTKNDLVLLPHAAEEPEDEEGDLLLREAGDEPAEGVDEHGHDQDPLPTVRVAQRAPDVPADQHA